jgi:sortase A
MSGSNVRVRGRLELIQLALFLVAGLALGWYAGVSAATARDQSSLPPSGNARSWLPPSGGSPPASSQLPRRAYVARLEIERLGLSTVVREGADDSTLRTAAGHLSDTPLPGEPGNSAIAGHRDTLFRKLKDVRVGDRIAVTRPAGTAYFTVRDTRVVAPTDVLVLAPTEGPTLTLVTCYPFRYIGPAPNRFVVRATEDARGVESAALTR